MDALEQAHFAAVKAWWEEQQMGECVCQEDGGKGRVVNLCIVRGRLAGQCFVLITQFHVTCVALAACLQGPLLPLLRCRRFHS